MNLRLAQIIINLNYTRSKNLAKKVTERLLEQILYTWQRNCLLSMLCMCSPFLPSLLLDVLLGALLERLEAVVVKRQCAEDHGPHRLQRELLDLEVAAADLKDANLVGREGEGRGRVKGKQ